MVEMSVITYLLGFCTGSVFGICTALIIAERMTRGRRIG